jgi:large subunit ribosomal protein L35
MSKLKTKKGAAKRFKLTKTGKIKYRPGGKGHLASSKGSERIRHLKKMATLVDKKKAKYIKRILPYG